MLDARACTSPAARGAPTSRRMNCHGAETREPLARVNSRKDPNALGAPARPVRGSSRSSHVPLGAGADRHFDERAAPDADLARVAIR